MPLTITGDGPGIPSLGQLVDIALADPAWRAWVEADPTRAGWSPYYVDSILWGGPDYPDGFPDDPDHPNGILELELEQALPIQSTPIDGMILLDPWSGEVLDVRVPDRALYDRAATSPSPTPSPAT